VRPNRVGFEICLSAGWLSRLCSRRARDIAAVVLFVAGAALMIATFAAWPLLGAVGVVIQAIAVWAVVSRWGSHAAARAQEWIDRHRRPADAGRTY
jgi:hypothetical protein